MAASLRPAGSRLFRTYGVARGQGPRRRRQPGRAVAQWFPPEDRKRFFSSSASSDASSAGRSQSVASDDPEDPDYPGSPVGRRRRRPGRRVSRNRPTATPRRLRLRARAPQKCSTPCDPLRPPPCPGRLSPDLSMCSQPTDGDELATSASLFSSPASPRGAVVSTGPSAAHVPATPLDRTVLPGSREATPRGRFTRMVLRARASLRSALFSLTDSGNPEDSEFGVNGEKVGESCGTGGRVGSSLEEGPGSCQQLGSPKAVPGDCRKASGGNDCERVRPSRKRSHREAVESSLQCKKSHRVGKESALARDRIRLQNACSWTKVRASFSFHKKKIVADVAEVCSAHTTASSLSGSLLSDCSDHPGAHRTSSAVSPWRSSSIYLLSPLNSLHVPDKKACDAGKVYWECNQEGPVPFSYCLSREKLERCEKIGEGVFGEVFQTLADHNTPVALKIIAIEGPDLVNGAHQKTFEEILPEIIISKELSLLSDEVCNRTEGFIGLNSVHCVQGSYPPLLLRAWDHYHAAKGSLNDRPDFFEEDQLFIVLEFEFGGTDLEQMKTKLSSLATAKSILHQITASLAVAEASLHFEHRDLHWGNVLLKKTGLRELQYTLNGETRAIPTCGLQVNIIDYTLSRLERDGVVVFCDVSRDEDLFSGEGDYQFEIYRLMRKENNNCWGEYHPYNNVLWLHYLTDKILKQMTFRTKCNTPAMKKMRKKIQHFHKTVLNFSSATDLLCEHSLFQ
ncbi:serine/threonine-protein kinase haspin [Lepus europaeus]|uniref:serine/threonine-protein kinase haspin n=1 Tax=Lepus europaeus TaxID=9983 RepID=UPI002B4924B9|nr:serine/threonine-protein kinase haspin [Lepus europaeus]